MKKIAAALLAVGLSISAAPAVAQGHTPPAHSQAALKAPVREVAPAFPTLGPATAENPLGVVIMPKRQPRGVVVVQGPTWDVDLQAWTVRYGLTSWRYAWADSSQQLWYQSPFIKN